MNRIVNATESDRILKEVENKLRSYPFKFKEAAILSGQQEGAYGWVTVNYLHENFAKVNSQFSGFKHCPFCSTQEVTEEKNSQTLKLTIHSMYCKHCWTSTSTRLHVVVLSKQTERCYSDLPRLKCNTCHNDRKSSPGAVVSVC